ncbi:hypothetical protein ACKI1J_24700 [Streptomyces scabiei]|uniref:hypothetical protein n=1 Tax=Streptomyces scabiei TaxID=1930 RepID=UPI0038F68A1D
MTGLGGPARLLDAWDQAVAEPSVARGAVLIVHGRRLSLDAVLDLPLGEASVLAARLYAEEFGDEVEGLLPCEGCGELLEVALSVSTLYGPGGPGADGTERRMVTAAGELAVRPPTTRDLLAVGGRPGPGPALLARCVSDGTGTPVDPAALDADTLELLDSVAEELAGAAAVVVRTSCPCCSSEARASVDVGGLLWDRVSAAVPVLLAEVAALASAFGWCESDVLALSPARRRAYLGLVDGGDR